MITARKMPQVLQDLMSQDASTAQAEIRRSTRCTPKQARELHEALKDGVYAVLQFPDEMALLLGDPQPSLLKRFFSQRSSLLRKLRRGARLEAMSEVMADGDLIQAQARDFLTGLQRQGDNWQVLQKLYSDPNDDFFQKRPQPKEPAGISTELVFAPEKFDPELLLEWLRKGQHRAAVRWVRQLSGASRQDCQEMIDRLEEMVFEDHPDPWRVASRLWPAVVAPLAGMPNPDWLESLEPRREELLDQLLNHRSSAAAQLVSASLECTGIEARRFLRLLGDGSNWEKTVLTFTTGQVFSSKPRLKLEAPKPKPPRPAALPGPVASAPTTPPHPVVLELTPSVSEAAPVLTGPAAPSPWEVEREKEKQAAEAAREKERQAAELARQKEQEQADLRRQQELQKAELARQQEQAATEAARAREQATTQKAREMEGQATADSRVRESAANQPQLNLPLAGVAAAAVVSSGLQAPKKLDLSDTDMVLDRLTRLGEACANRNTGEALFILEEMEQAGFNRSYVAARFPALLPILPDDPWSEQLDQLAKFAPTLSKLLKGETNPAQLVQELMKGGELDQLVTSLEKAWKTKNKADVENAMGLLKRNPHLTEQVNQRLPWLGDLMDLDRDGKPDVLEMIDDPGAYFADLMRTRFPELEARLGETRIQKIKELLPELLQAMKDRNMRGVMRVMSRLRLGPSDVKALLAALKHMH